MNKVAIIVIVIAVAVITIILVTNKHPLYSKISPQEAKQLMSKDCVILDVRTPEEYKEGHIPDAILIPDYSITELAPQQLPDKDKLILVYCRSGNRSKKASELLLKMGYTNVKYFGGIIDWPYEVVK